MTGLESILSQIAGDGQKEAEEGVVSVRSRFAGDEGQKGLEEFMAAIQEEIVKKAIRQMEKKEEK